MVPPPTVLQGLMGHEKSETTRIYAELSESTLGRNFIRKYI